VRKLFRRESGRPESARPGGVRPESVRPGGGARRGPGLRVTAPLVAVLFTILVGALIMLAGGANPIRAYLILIWFSLGRVDSIASILFKATPLIFTGLSMVIAFRLNLFNIGVEGQYMIGAFTAAIVGFSLKGLPAVVHLPLMLLAGMAGGMLWAAIPIYLKIKRGVHEVISTIMMNYIAYSLLHWLLTDIFLDRSQSMSQGGFGSPRVRTPDLAPSARMPTLHQLTSLFGLDLPHYIYVSYFLFIGIGVAFLVHYLIWRTPLGYEIRAVAQNGPAAEAAGINANRVVVKTFLLSAAVAGLAGLSDLMAFYGYYDIDFARGYGFDGIAVALLGKNTPAGAVAGALLFGFLGRGAEGIQILADVPMEVITILQSVMILSIVVAYEMISRHVRAQKKKEVQSET
jgi:ABC-type uncharacterized transport system permease subunit